MLREKREIKLRYELLSPNKNKGQHSIDGLMNDLPSQQIQLKIIYSGLHFNKLQLDITESRTEQYRIVSYRIVLGSAI